MSKKLIMPVLAVFALSATANAQGTWYTDQATWLANLTSSVTTADFNSIPGSNSYTENGVTATADGGFFDLGIGALSTNNSADYITFTFSGNAFAGFFGMTDLPGAPVSDGMYFFVDGSLTNVYSFTSTTTGSGYTFLCYISNSASNISVTVSGDDTPEFVTVNSFSRAIGSNPAAPGGGGVVPEPGTVVSMGLLGAGVLGLVVRSRRRISN
ncbi:MAG: PEP-CTERM sorting domain-containing protein [Armatimonadota bacterium]